MSVETTNIFEEISSGLDPLVQEYLNRALHENIVDLYVEYYNREVDLEYQPGNHTNEAATLKIIVKQCEQRIIDKALRENGYDSRIVLKYAKNKK